MLRPGDRVALRGDLGAGKTTFVRLLAAAMGAPAGLVASPTFVIVNQYPIPGRAPLELVHADFYRLTSAEDLEPVGWDRLVGPGSIVLAEWPERAAGALGSAGSYAEVELVAIGAEARRMTVRLPEAWRGRHGAAELIARPPVVCPVSGRPVAPTSATYPFADERSKMADLGRWFAGGYSVERDLTQDDLDES